MKHLLSLLALLLVASPVSAGDDSSPKAVAQAFYDGYMKALADNTDTVKYVSNSALVTPKFKSSYKTFMKAPEYDPIINGQDYPDAGFAASKEKIDGEKATVLMKSRDASFDNSVEVRLRNKDGVWLIAGIGDLVP